MHKNISANKTIMTILSRAVILLVLPVLLIQGNLLSFSYRYGALAVVFVVVIALSLKEKMTLKDIGIRTDNLMPSALPYTLFTILGAVSLFVMAHAFSITPAPEWWSYTALCVSVLLSFAQEYIYRAFFRPDFRKLWGHCMP